MSTERQDAQVEVKVPAQNGRKAYSYFRNASAAKKGAAGVGAALALGGLGAAAIALRKKPEEQKPIPVTEPASILPQSPPNKVGEFAKKAAIKVGGTAASLGAGVIANKAITVGLRPIIEKGANKAGEKDSETRRARWRAEEAAAEEEYFRYKAKKDLEREAARQGEIESRRLAPPDRLPSPKPKPEIGGALVPVNKPETPTPPPPTRLPYNPPASKVSTGGLTIAASESGKSSGSAIAEPQKPLLTRAAGSAGAAAGKLYRKTKERLERDRVARKNLADKTIDLNEAAKKAGSTTRSTLNAVDNFARSFMQTFVDKNNTVDVKASEVKTTRREMPKRIRRANMTTNRVWNKTSRRYESLDERIDSFVEQLREDAKCGSGTKPCGKICIPQEKNCAGETAKAFGKGAVQALAGPIGSGTYRALRSRGHGRGASVAGAIGANVAATAGSLALAAHAINKAEEENQKQAKK